MSEPTDEENIERLIKSKDIQSIITTTVQQQKLRKSETHTKKRRQTQTFVFTTDDFSQGRGEFQPKEIQIIQSKQESTKINRFERIITDQVNLPDNVNMDGLVNKHTLFNETDFDGLESVNSFNANEANAKNRKPLTLELSGELESNNNVTLSRQYSSVQRLEGNVVENFMRVLDQFRKGEVDLLQKGDEVMAKLV